MKATAQPDQQRTGAVRTSLPSWVVSVLLHGLLLVICAMVTWVVSAPKEPDRAFNLTPAVAGIGDDRGPGGGSPRPAAGRPQARAERAALPVAPSKVLDRPFDMLMPRAPDPVGSVSGDPGRRMLHSLASDARNDDAEVSGRGLGGTGRGTGAGFGDYLAGLGARGLDVVLIIDATDSMQPFIDQAKERLHAIMDVVNGLVPGTRFGVVAYKDYGDDYGAHAVKVLSLTDDVLAVRQFINLIIAGGGGDLPEPIHEALGAAIDRKSMEWGMQRKQVIILVGDSPIHSSGREPAYSLATEFARRGGTLNVVDVGGAINIRMQREMVQPDLQVIAQKGKGSAFLLADTDAFWRYLITSAFDERFKDDVDIIIEKYVRGHPASSPAGR